MDQIDESISNIQIQVSVEGGGSPAGLGLSASDVQAVIDLVGSNTDLRDQLIAHLGLGVGR